MARAAAALLIVLAGCATAPSKTVSKDGYRFSTLASSPRNSESLFVVLTFSGGGTRAAALAHGVLDELRRTEIDWSGRRTLLDEVDVISSVSGGSIAAAHYALFRDAHFATFEEKFLHRGVTWDLIRRSLRPDRLARLMSRDYNRGDVAAEHFASTLFDHATFAELRQRGRPFLILNATDLSQGAPFEFTQDQFDYLCSDVNAFSIGRAVAASAAFPFLLTPIPIRNDAAACEADERDARLAREHDRTRNPTRFAKAGVLLSYRDAQRRPYVHLVDGGVADNLGVHTIVDALNEDLSAFTLRPKAGKLQKLVVIVVDAKTGGSVAMDQNPRPPRIFTSVPASAFAPMAVVSAQIMDNVRIKMNDLREGGVVDTYLIHVSFDELDSEDDVRFFKSISTNFGLPPATADRIVNAGRQILRKSDEFQRLRRDLGAR